MNIILSSNYFSSLAVFPIIFFIYIRRVNYVFILMNAWMAFCALVVGLFTKKMVGKFFVRTISALISEKESE